MLTKMLNHAPSEPDDQQRLSEMATAVLKSLEKLKNVVLEGTSKVDSIAANVEQKISEGLQPIVDKAEKINLDVREIDVKTTSAADEARTKAEEDLTAVLDAIAKIDSAFPKMGTSRTTCSKCKVLCRVLAVSGSSD